MPRYSKYVRITALPYRPTFFLQFHMNCRNLCVRYSFCKRISVVITSPKYLHKSTCLMRHFSMICRNLCERLYSKIIFSKSHYEDGRKYCRRCEVYYCHNGVFCPRCVMALLVSSAPTFDLVCMFFHYLFDFTIANLSKIHVKLPYSGKRFWRIKDYHLVAVPYNLF